MYQTCRHVMPSGLRCQSPAMRGAAFCYHHARRAASHHNHPTEARIQIAPNLDRHGIAQTLRQVMNALANNHISARRASILLYGLQMAAADPERPSSALPPIDPAQLAAEITAMLGQRAKNG